MCLALGFMNSYAKKAHEKKGKKTDEEDVPPRPVMANAPPQTTAAVQGGVPVSQ